MASPPTNSTITVFIDGTVLITASISGTGAGRDVLEHAVRGTLDAWISHDVLEETERNISAKAPQALAQFYAYRDSLSSRLINPTWEQVREVAQSVEPKDAPIVAAAVAARAVYLATYDQKHLLRKRQQIWETYSVMVVTPIEVLYVLPADE